MTCRSVAFHIVLYKINRHIMPLLLSMKELVNLTCALHLPALIMDGLPDLSITLMNLCVVLDSIWHQTSFTTGCHAKIDSVRGGVTSDRAAEANSSKAQSNINGINPMLVVPKPSNRPIDRPVGSGMRVVCLNRTLQLAFRLSALGTSRIQNLSYSTKKPCHSICSLPNN
jgi:hypothetical protein